jgi:hypothetical protein
VPAILSLFGEPNLGLRLQTAGSVLGARSLLSMSQASGRNQCARSQARGCALPSVVLLLPSVLPSAVTMRVRIARAR